MLIEVTLNKFNEALECVRCGKLIKSEDTGDEVLYRQAYIYIVEGKKYADEVYCTDCMLKIEEAKMIEGDAEIIKVFETFETVSDMRQCRKKPIIVYAKQMDTPFQVESMEGNYKTGKKGDYLVRGVEGELYICDRDIFDRTYDWV